MTSYRDEYRGASRDFFWTLPRVLLAAFVAVAAVFLLMVVLTPLTIGFGWVSGEANLRSFASFKATYAEAFDDVKALDALTTQSCRFHAQVLAAQKAGDTTTATQRSSQELAVSNRYDSLKGQYDAYMSDHFRGGVNHPGLSLPYPTLAERQKELC